MYKKRFFSSSNLKFRLEYKVYIYIKLYEINGLGIIK